MSSIFTQIYTGTILAFILGFAKLESANRQKWLKAFLALAKNARFAPSQVVVK
jgi:hypothetical protein